MLMPWRSTVSETCRWAMISFLELLCGRDRTRWKHATAPG